VLRCLKSVIKDAKRRGNVAQNVASDVTIKADKRSEGRLEVGVDIPMPAEVSKILAAATAGRRRALLVTAVFTGLRSSELRGLRWERRPGEGRGAREAARQPLQRHRPAEVCGWHAHGADRPVPRQYTQGMAAAVPGPGHRTQGRREQARARIAPRLPTGNGNVESRGNLLKNELWPAQVAAGVTVMKLCKDGKRAAKAKYAGLHALRHFYASWCINRKVDGSLELPPKVVQERLGHATSR